MVNVLLFGLSLAGAVAAQIVNGPSMVALDNSGGGGAVTPTPAPNPTGYLQAMPYPSFQAGGYKQLDCGYGYAKQGDGSCKPESWYTDSGCYGTTIIIQYAYMHFRFALYTVADITVQRPISWRQLRRWLYGHDEGDHDGHSDYEGDRHRGTSHSSKIQESWLTRINADTNRQ